MLITASQIVDWANTNTKVAQTQLPHWIRRLCYDPNMTRQISFPAGDSTSVPGWDGILYSEKGNAWVPVGESRWEIGCNKDINSKANEDYHKRTEKTSEAERLSCTFVFVTPRRWKRKPDWIKEQSSKCEWSSVRAYDADDLEQWLEQTPAVALQIAEELNKSGWGVESLQKYWAWWSQQCNPAITYDALFMDRSSVFTNLNKRIQAATSLSEQNYLLGIRADSVEEAAAFAAAVIMASGNQQHQAIMVTDPKGWHFVESNPQLSIAISVTTEIAIKPVMRDNLLVIVPYSMGRMDGEPKAEELILARPNIYEFMKALIAIGMDESDAKRYALSTGRSWTVFRRQRATNVAIQNPAWLNSPQSVSLPLLCLLGAWHGDNPTDRGMVERLADRPYEKIELDLRQLARLDDAPLLSIGDVWKAKSPLELLNMFGDRITSYQLDRFFNLTRELLSMPDPQLELLDEDRWMAQINGKVLPYSNLLIEAVCDSLIKLAVSDLENVELRVIRLVHELLDKADGQRWLSLSSSLPSLAEAAPEVFLGAVEESLRQPDAPVSQLITETGYSGLFGRNWHAGLLWALEILAWAPNRLARVALILAQLSHLPMKGNWGNKPSNSLLGLFRSWFPQTAANLSERIEVLNLLILKDEGVAFDVLERLLADEPQTVFPASRPKWRNDDAGVGHGVTYAESDEMLGFAKAELLKISDGNATRIASIMLNTTLGHRHEILKVLELLKPFTHVATPDGERETLRAALRKILHWHRNYDESSQDELDKWLKTVEYYYECLAPQDLVIRHRWYFHNAWVELPISEGDIDFQEKSNAIKHFRTTALHEIYQDYGIHGIESLVATCNEPEIVGATLAEVSWNDTSWPEWLSEKGEDFVPGTNMTRCIAGFLQNLSPVVSRNMLHSVVAIGKQRGWDTNKFVRFLCLATIEKETWLLAEACGSEVHLAYWRNVQPNAFHKQEDLVFAIENILKANRPKSALIYCQYSIEKVPPSLIVSALKKLIKGEEVDGPNLESWQLAKILEHLENSDEVEKNVLVQIEFGLFPLLQYRHEASASSLFEYIMSDPEIFTELICLAFKPRHRGQENSYETSEPIAERALMLLYNCMRIPGTQPDGTIDAEKFTQFIDSVRNSCQLADRAIVCDHILGQILAHSPADEDGTWPFTPAKNLLDRPELNEMRVGFHNGVMNKRGITSRSSWDGGSQERDLAAYYRGLSVRIQNTHPNIAAKLEEIAKNYERQGQHEDSEAYLNMESY